MNWFGRQKQGARGGAQAREETQETRESFPNCLLDKMKAALLLLLVTITAVTTVAGGKNKEKNKPSQHGSECADWRYGNCVPSNGDCGAGFREGSCDQQTKKMKCKVPCNWKKEFGADCKYRFGTWGECDAGSGSKTRTGTLKKALYNAECQQTISVSKPCPGKTREKPKERKQKSRGQSRGFRVKDKIETKQ